MKKEEAIAYSIMESVTEPVKPSNVELIRENGLEYVRFSTVLQSFNGLNRNKRNYSDTAVMSGLHADHIQELIANRTWQGEAGHPENTDVGRIVTINPANTSHTILSFEQSKKNILSGVVETLDDGGGVGTKMGRQIMQGMIPAFSLRALAKLIKKSDGTSLVQSKPHIVTYDWVILPSHREAYGKTQGISQVIKDVKSNGNVMNESFNPILESSLIDFIKDESHNIKLISNICEIGLEDAKISGDKKFIILKENGREFHVKIEDKIRNDVGIYLSSF